MVYPKVINETVYQRATSFLLLVNLILTVTWTQGEASLTPDLSTINEGSNSHSNIDKSQPSSSSSAIDDNHSLEKRSASIPEEVYPRWNLVNPRSSTSNGLIISSSSLSSPLSSLTSYTDEYEADLDSPDSSASSSSSSSSSSFPLTSSDSEFNVNNNYNKRDGSRYAFGLGKRGSAPESRYSFGIGKRLPELSRNMYLAGSKRLPNRFQFGLGKKSRYSFGLGKRDLYEYIKRRYNFGIGKRALAQRYAFGLGK